MIIKVTFFLLAASIIESAVLDPALYLVPSPPLMQASGSLSPGNMWGSTLEERTVRHVREKENIAEITQKTTAVESRMFWPRNNSPDPVLCVHIPLTFSLTGSYGRVASLPTSVIGNRYTSVAGLGASVSSNVGSTLFGKTGVGNVYGNYGRAALAGSSYGSYGSGVRVYGSDNMAAWSGWGNGKWGHYGKG